MRTTLFELVAPTIAKTDSLFNLADEVYVVPTLPAYAILSYKLDYCSSLLELGRKETIWLPMSYIAALFGR